jgi:hypothetical protein
LTYVSAYDAHIFTRRVCPPDGRSSQDSTALGSGWNTHSEADSDRSALLYGRRSATGVGFSRSAEALIAGCRARPRSRISRTKGKRAFWPPSILLRNADHRDAERLTSAGTYNRIADDKVVTLGSGIGEPLSASDRDNRLKRYTDGALRTARESFRPRARGRTTFARKARPSGRSFAGLCSGRMALATTATPPFDACSSLTRSVGVAIDKRLSALLPSAKLVPNGST